MENCYSTKIVWNLLDLVEKKDNEISELKKELKEYSGAVADKRYQINELKKEIQGLRCNILLLKAMLSQFMEEKSE